eukprot:5045212-Amphidinium_carterae.1
MRRRHRSHVITLHVRACDYAKDRVLHLHDRWKELLVLNEHDAEADLIQFHRCAATCSDVRMNNSAASKSVGHCQRNTWALKLVKGQSRDGY